MAANYWESTQRKYWQFTKLELSNLRQELEEEDRTLVQTYPLPQIRHISIFFNQGKTASKCVAAVPNVPVVLKKLSHKLNVRQQAIATAQLFLRRFYTKVEIRRTNPYLLAATALYLACKTEECPQHIRMVVNQANELWSEHFGPRDTSRLGECEFFLISEMNSQMIIHQPYRSLNVLAAEFALAPEETQQAWTIINDHYMTDLPLLYAPHIIALIAIMLVLAPALTTAAQRNGQGQQNTVQTTLQRVAQERMAAAKDQRSLPNVQTKLQRFTSWLSSSTVDIEAMIDAAQEMISFYEVLADYPEKSVESQIHRFIKGRNLYK